MLKPITIIVIIFSALYISYIIFEHYYYNFLRNKLKKVIHVNGIRGKSTVTRLIDAGLRGCGLKVVSKTTGTIPTFINIQNKEERIKRLGPSNIREQLRTIKKAVKSGAEYLVIECMAVNPEYQNICEHKILHSDITVITNVRYDHLDVMGNSLESIATSLGNTTPNNGILVLGEDTCKNIFLDLCKQNNANFRLSKKYEGNELFDTFRENIACALEVCDALGLDKDKFFEGMKNYIHDPGALSIYKKDNTIFINGFSINDPDSILKVYDTLKYDHKDITILLNERSDRPFRTSQHIEMLKTMEYKKVLICGDNISYLKLSLAQSQIDATIIKKIEDIKDEKIIFGCGNIKNLGFKIIDYYKKGEKL